MDSKPNLKTPLPSIGRPATNALISSGFIYLEDLARISEKELSDMHGVGPKAVVILKAELEARKLKLAE